MWAHALDNKLTFSLYLSVHVRNLELFSLRTRLQFGLCTYSWRCLSPKPNLRLTFDLGAYGGRVTPSVYVSPVSTCWYTRSRIKSGRPLMLDTFDLCHSPR